MLRNLFVPVVMTSLVLLMFPPAHAAAEKTAAPAAVEAAPKANPPPPPSPPANPRAKIQDDIASAVLTAMIKSDDPRALALSAKFMRNADLAPNEERSEENQNARQEAQLAKAFGLIAKPEHKAAEGFVRYAVASFCVAFPDRKLCAEKDRLIEYANQDMTNAVPWIMVAAREFAAGRNLEAQLFLARAADAKTSSWYYREAVATALQYANRAKGVDAKFADASVVAFTVAGGTTIPEFRRLSQMCAPSPEGKLPEGRYEACRKIAALLQNKAETNVEMIVALRALERMATGENKADEAKQHEAALTRFQGDINRLWKEAMKFPPTTPAEAERVTAFVTELATSGERAATVSAQKKYLVAAATLPAK
jgi:hypothetical protein